MGNLRDQMEALAQGIVTATRERKMAVGDNKAQTASMLSGFGREHAAMARALKSGLAAGCLDRSANVGMMREVFRRDHDRMGFDLQQKLVQSTEAVATFVAALRADFNKAHSHMTKAQRAGLAKDRRDRSREVTDLMNNLQVSRGEMAQELAESLAKSTQEIKSQVSGSRRALQEDIQAARQIWSSLSATEAGGANQSRGSSRRRGG